MNPKTLDALEWSTLLEHYSLHCRSAPAKSLALTITPSNTLKEAERLLSFTEEAYRFQELNSLPCLSFLENLHPTLERLQKEVVLDGKELRSLAKLAEISLELTTIFSQNKDPFPLLHALAQNITNLSAQVKLIHSAIDETGAVLDSASPTLRGLRDQERKLHHQARDRLEKVLQQAFRDGYLQDKFYDFRDGRYLIPVKAEFRNRISGFVVESSATKATVFMEPASVRDCNDQLKQTALFIEEEIYRILQELSQKLYPHSNAFLASYETSIELDLTCARGVFAYQYSQIRGVSCPEFKDNIYLEELYHPLLGFVIPPESIVRNTLQLGPKKKILVISGPNTGGKTVLLKAVGLCSLMAQAGFFLPCAGYATLPFFTQVLPQIGDSQNLELSLSSFSGSILQIKEILGESGANSLVLVDEILHATDPEEATALSHAILDDLQKRGTYSIVTTHLNGLKVAAQTEFENASMEFDPEEMSPTYRIRMGVPGSSRALEIAQRLGLSPSLIENARANLSAAKVQEQKALDQLEFREKELQKILEESTLLRATLEEEKNRQIALSHALEQQKLSFRREAWSKVKEEQKSTLQQLENLISIYKAKLHSVEEKHQAALEAQTHVQTAKESFHKVEKAVEEIAPPATPGKEQQQKEKNVLQMGGIVFLKHLQSEATLLSDPSSRQKSAEVLLGQMRLQVAWDQIEPRPNESHPLKQSTLGWKMASSKSSSMAETDCPPELYLIGKTVEEALPALELYLDRASRSSRAFVRIVHGHGSGTLKRTVRDFLSRCGYDLKFRPGTSQEGGEGCTVIEFT